MPDILLKHALGALRPVDAQGEEVLRGIKNGAIVKATIKRPRNVRHHRLYWGLVSILFDNQSRYSTPEELSDVIKVATGHCTVIQTGDGKEIRIPKSISFAKMDQDAFRQFFDRVVDLAVTRIIPGLSRDDLRREVLEMIGERQEAA